MDKNDGIILDALQRDSSLSIAELADIAGVSTSACHRRIKSLEAAEIIRGYSAQLDAHKLGLKLSSFVEITLNSQSSEAMAAFEHAVLEYPDILECHLMSGNADYLLRVVARDLEHFDVIHRNCLSRLPGVSSMRSSFAIRTIKRWSGYPVSAR